MALLALLLVLLPSAFGQLVFNVGGSGTTKQVFVKGYYAGGTGGGAEGTDAYRCVYMYQPDNANRSSVPTYHDANWPYVQLVSGPITAPATLVPLLSVTAGSLVVRINGLPIYLFVGDTTTGTCSCDGVDGFFTINATGLSYDQPVVVKPMSTAGNALETISVAFPSPPAPTPPPLVFSIGGTGPTGQVFVSGYFGGYTGGGSQGTSATRCVYMYAPDNANRSSTPTYHDADWPYVELDFGPIVAPASLVPLISVSAGSRVVRINGLPLYLFVGDTKTGACFCDGVDGFFTINATGFSYNQPVVVKPITTAYSNLSVPIYAASPPAPLSPPPPRSPVPPPAPRRPPPPPPPFVLSVGGTGTTRQVFAAGALPGQTAGGPATNANRCVYYDGNDNVVHSPTPTFIGPDWPYVRLPSLATPLHAPASLAKLVTVTPGSLVVRVNGLALYQFSGDFDSAQCVGVPDGVEFFTVNATGGSFDPKITVVPIAKTTNANVTIVVV